MLLMVKSVLYDQCLSFVNKRQEAIQRSISEIEASFNSEIKNSAGDKHETGRAMLQIEREKLGNQLLEVETIGRTLQKIDITNHSNVIKLGSIVLTSKANYFIAISAGELQYENQLFYAISLQTPIGKALLGKQTGAIISFRGNSFKVLEVL